VIARIVAVVFGAMVVLAVAGLVLAHFGIVVLLALGLVALGHCARRRRV
jgi:hypothetical protein